MRRAARVDANQGAIVRTLRQMGVAVYVIGKPVDLMCCNARGVISLLEVKSGDNTLTREQVEFIEGWPGDVHVVRNSDEAIMAALGAEILA